ncbi:MAG: NtaA/DmoA family FMN-dependent monooxygenase [Reyranella sp.]|uniref:NtaA/DmoA family FMN-dependent monooxygenase n=1 Tax=Reyranella sp. TaxID=1929291 RepID=UPI0027320756|nr:NtaA/DmoA family FMN-dependent monooxygenase [Reyranella sp.]MDP1964665.1 NtaA/DmoA family FMN-dependent monooxygenase [Reyranella sp.]MDP2376740.1 NtaA/DmoA family FMN-dependent monooxygenase [Reyranella sp.]
MTKPFHLAWFLSQGYGPKSWRSQWPGSDLGRWMMPDIFVDLARGMERACMDYMIIEDSSMVPYTYKGSHDVYLKYAASTPKLDPAVLVSYLAQATSRLGLVPTLSTSEYPPYLMARLVNTLDHVTEGRIGWNCVTGSNDGAAENYGHVGQRPHDERYDVADEFADVVTRLWEAWEPDAVVLDREKPMFADGSKVHPINHAGKYFKVRGPLNAPRSPQGRVPICQAGGSPRGQDFASKWADTIITNAVTVEGMKTFREDVRRRAVTHGRDPDTIKVLFLAYPIVDTTMEAARDRRRLQQEDSGRHLDLQLSGMSRLTNIDFSKFPLDEPLPELSTNGHQSSLAKWIGKTPRSLAEGSNSRQGVDLVGTADQVAGLMQDIMQEVGGDGFLLFNAYFDRRYIMEVCDGLVPELQRRGLTRKAYAHKHFRDNLLEF